MLPRSPLSAVSTPPPSTVHALALHLLPGGVLWLDSEGLVHPGDRRTVRLPFTFASGSGYGDFRHQTVYEIELVIATIPAITDDYRLRAELTSYARFVVGNGATLRDRLAGVTLATWLQGR